VSTDLREYFNKMPRLGVLATSGKDGKVDAAYFGSAQMVDGKTIFMGCGKNRRSPTSRRTRTPSS